MHKVLVSACLLGQPVRYDGQSKGIVSDWLQALGAEGRALAFCPEVAGGLPTPRPPAERQGERVVTESGLDVTEEFDRGAALALALCQQQGILRNGHFVSLGRFRTGSIRPRLQTRVVSGLGAFVQPGGIGIKKAVRRGLDFHFLLR